MTSRVMLLKVVSIEVIAEVEVEVEMAEVVEVAEKVEVVEETVGTVVVGEDGDLEEEAEVVEDGDPEAEAEVVEDGHLEAEAVVGAAEAGEAAEVDGVDVDAKHHMCIKPATCDKQ